MIKNISELREKRIEYIQRFLKECTVTEKIDTYYVTVEVISKNNFLPNSKGLSLAFCMLIVEKKRK